MNSSSVAGKENSMAYIPAFDRIGLSGSPTNIVDCKCYICYNCAWLIVSSYPGLLLIGELTLISVTKVFTISFGATQFPGIG